MDNCCAACCWPPPPTLMSAAAVVGTLFMLAACCCWILRSFALLFFDVGSIMRRSASRQVHLQQRRFECDDDVIDVAVDDDALEDGFEDLR